MMPLHVGEGMVYSLDPLIVLAGVFWFAVIMSFVWSRTNGTRSVVRSTHRTRRPGP